MGANFQTMRLPGDTPRAAVISKFKKAQDQDRHENGHSYSGGFGQAPGIRFINQSFPSEGEAYDWLVENHCHKWDEALVVSYPDNWLIGAWCAE